jgi:uncharacterized repeat protein (TIGR01451 family)
VKVIEKRGLRGNLSTLLGTLAFALGLAAGAGFSGALPVGAEPPGPIRKDTGPVITPLLGLPDLAISIHDLPNQVVGGTDVAYSLIVRNLSNVDAANVTVRHTLPAGATFVRFSVLSPWNCGHVGGVVTCTRPTMPAGLTGPTLRITIVARAPLTAGPLVIMAAVDPVPGEHFTTNNSASATILNLGAPDLIPIVSGTPWFFSTGGPLIIGIPPPNYKEFRGVTLHLSVKNQGTGFSPATRLRIELLSSSVARFMGDEMCPPNARFADGSCILHNLPAACGFSQNVAICSIPELVGGAVSGQFVANVSVTISAAILPITFVVRADADNAVTESNENNNILALTVTGTVP